MLEDATKALLFRDGDPVEIRIPRTTAAFQNQGGSPSLGRLLVPVFSDEPSTAYLKPFQAEGVRWLLSRKAALLADEMGLGKTVQAISALRSLAGSFSARRALVLCPKTLIANWLHEFAHWTPELLVAAAPDGADDARWRRCFVDSHVVVSNYEKLRQTPDPLLSEGVDVLICDEAHRLRNIGSDLSKGVRRIKAERRWALSGTPIERHAEDLASILAFLDPVRFAVDDSRHGIELLREKAREYVLRRTRDEVLPELPEALDRREYLELSPLQRREYDDVATGIQPGYRRDADQQLAVLNELLSICDGDSSGTESSKLDRALEIVEDVIAAGEKAVVFSYRIEPLQQLQSRIQRVGLGSRSALLHGGCSAEERARVIEKFKREPELSVLLLSLFIGGEGLTLTAANHVVFLNLWWNPSSNYQGRDRVVRIGQQKTVYVHSFICNDTLEVHLERILARKEEIYRRGLAALGASRAASRNDLVEELFAAVAPQPSES